jgi:DNA recombination protein RmuC
MLRTAHFAWQQAALSRNAQAVFQLGKELYERLGTMGRHVEEVGQALSNATRAYNRTVGSLESRVLVSARKLNELGVVDGEVAAPRPVDEAPRALSAAELLDDGPVGPLDGLVEDGPAGPPDGELIDDELVVAPRSDTAEQVGYGNQVVPTQAGGSRDAGQKGGGSAW